MATAPRAPYEALLAYSRETATLRSCHQLLGWDQQTYLPGKAAGHRARQMAALHGLVHRRMCAPALADLLEQAEEHARAEGPDSDAAANVREIRRERERAVRVPPELVEEIARTTALARDAWVSARRESDYPVFLPWLETILTLTRRKAEALGYEDHPYDALLDAYEPGETAASIRAVFAPLRELQTALLDRILGSSRAVDTSPLHRRYPQADQTRIGLQAATAIGFDFAGGRLDVTTHPFCSGMGPGDVRLTTRYNETFFNEAFFSILHEAGHGIYEQGLDPEAYGTPLGLARSTAVHESQSRLWENLVGRSRGFWRHFYPVVQAAFPEALGDVGEEGFYRAINAVEPSLIRVEADEVTYNLHIILRFELELALLSGALAPKDLPDAWSETFERFLRVRPPTDALGCLQDVHWSAGLFAYFPTYALGNVYASQILEAAERELGDLQEAFARGEFVPLLGWLRERIYRQGRRYEPRRLLEVVTGSAPDPAALLRHLEGKYGEIYGLKNP